MVEFLDNIYPLLDRHVQRYIDRDFTDLMISFGCTGGNTDRSTLPNLAAEHIHKVRGESIARAPRAELGAVVSGIKLTEQLFRA